MIKPTTVQSTKKELSHMQKDIYGYKVTNTIKVNRTARACVFLLEKDNRISRSGAIRKLLLRFIISTVERLLIRKIHLDVYGLLLSDRILRNRAQAEKWYTMKIYKENFCPRK